jgi:hypothetical protein
MEATVYLFKIFSTHDKKIDLETGELIYEVSLKNHIGAGINRNEWYSRPLSEIEELLKLCKDKFGNAKYDMGIPPGLQKKETRTIYEELGGIKIVTERRSFTRNEYYDFIEKLNGLLIEK